MELVVVTGVVKGSSGGGGDENCNDYSVKEVLVNGKINKCHGKQTV